MRQRQRSSVLPWSAPTENKNVTGLPNQFGAIPQLNDFFFFLLQMSLCNISKDVSVIYNVYLIISVFLLKHGRFFLLLFQEVVASVFMGAEEMMEYLHTV